VLIGRAPLRISFSGGGTDFEDYHNSHTGYSICTSINLYTYVIAKKRNDNLLQGFSPDFASHLSPSSYKKVKPLWGHEIPLACLKELKFKEGLDIFICTDVSAGSGLGSSSSLATNIVNVISTMKNKKWSKNKIAMLAYKISTSNLKWNIGKQDEFASAFGGINLYKYTKNKVTVTPVKLNKSTRNEIEKNSLLFFIGNRKPSYDILSEQLKNINKNKSETINALHKVKELTLEMYTALRKNDLNLFQDILKQSWIEKKKYASGITNPKIDAIIKKGFSLGAGAMKVTGAGGGGHLYMYAEKSKHKRIIRNMSKIGIQNIDFTFTKDGAKVVDVGDI
tara:strand:+ start:12905 stop:13915 length:1011 start_codon:yes stop_codon:yes gene_type:complete